MQCARRALTQSNWLPNNLGTNCLNYIGISFTRKDCKRSINIYF